MCGEKVYLLGISDDGTDQGEEERDVEDDSAHTDEAAVELHVWGDWFLWVGMLLFVCVFLCGVGTCSYYFINM